jgi:threonine/homoserine/homoserine lactone efflux protein
VSGTAVDATAPGTPVAGTAARFSEGLVVQLANPKAAAFLLALYPQFLPGGVVDLRAVLVLATIQVTVETCLYLALAAGVGSLGARLRRPFVTRVIEGTTGAVLVALGLRLAVERR